MIANRPYKTTTIHIKKKKHILHYFLLSYLRSVYIIVTLVNITTV